MMNKWMIFISLSLSGGALRAFFMASHDAQFYFDPGSNTLSTADPDHKWSYRWDLNSADGDFSHAIRLHPDFAAAFAE